MIMKMRRGLPYVTAEIEYRGRQAKVKDALDQSRSLEGSYV